MSSLAFARSNTGRATASGRRCTGMTLAPGVDRREHENRPAGLDLLELVLEEVRVGQTIDDQALARVELGTLRRRRRQERLPYRPGQLPAKVLLLEEQCDRDVVGGILGVLSEVRRQEHDRRLDALDVLEAIQRELE